MRFDLKISQIGWILVGVPLAFELLFVGLLTYSVHQAELEIKRQEHAKDIVYYTSSAATYATQCAVNVGAYSVSRAEHFKDLYQENKSRTKEAFNQLESLLTASRDSEYLSKAKEGDLFTLNCFLDKEIWPLKIKFVGRETITTELGKIKALKFRPIVQKGRIFKKEEDLNVWISDDDNHIVLKAQADVLIGSIKMELTKAINLANDIAKAN